MNKKSFVAGLLGSLALVAQVSASFIDLTGGFNVVTFNDFTLKEAKHTVGAIAAGGNVSIGSSFGINTGEYLITAIVAGGSVTLGDNGQVHGDVLAGKSITVGSNVTVLGDRYANSSVLPFTPDYSSADRLSDLYVDTPLIDGIVKDSKLILNGTDDVNYYNVNAKDLATVWSLQIADQSKYSIINVIGSSAELHYDKQGIVASNILFNFVDATDLKIASVYGNILAKDAAVSSLWGGHMTGVLVAKSYHGETQFDMSNFNPPTKDVPEPPTVSMILFGMFGLIAASRKRFANNK